ncbi:Flp family type IVb pilin [Paramagnetospirillum kuznetsovii]|uniref:Flp family type IVb pilin n=1 Tax=Paramagnetospirillum kuznetsovii TaxID=2053833 RepID=A0A364P3X4_9PROT|nr:Flp family type IVb pilin [Paramagnetospirillum kuznetsovii]
MKSIRSLTSKYIRSENGATAIEYGLIAALISIAALTAFQAIGPRLLTTFGTVSTGLQ